VHTYLERSATHIVKKISVIIGLLVLGLAGLLGYTFFRNQQGSQRVMVVKDLSAVVPGLGLRTLHERGYTGKGVNVAIIDGSLLADHEEYGDRLVHFEKIGDVNDTDLYHGTTVASVFVGSRCGVVPEASLHFFATNLADEENVLEALERLLLYNETLEPSHRIRIVSISTGLRQYEAAFHSLIRQANDQGIIVFTSTMPTVTNPPFALREAAHDSQKDMDSLDNIVIGEWMDEFLSKNGMTRGELAATRKGGDLEKGYITLYLPCARRYVASHTIKDGYVYEYDGGLSWATPFLAGLAAMALQVNPELTNDELLLLLRDSIVTNKHGLDVVDPQLLIRLASGAISPGP
jgi:hypothetical protein